ADRAECGFALMRALWAIPTGLVNARPIGHALDESDRQSQRQRQEALMSGEPRQDQDRFTFEQASDEHGQVAMVGEQLRERRATPPRARRHIVMRPRREPRAHCNEPMSPCTCAIAAETATPSTSADHDLRFIDAFPK